MNSKDVKSIVIHLSTKKLLEEAKEDKYQTYDTVIRQLIKDSKELKALREKEQKSK
jgi:hypothetical protein